MPILKSSEKGFNCVVTLLMIWIKLGPQTNINLEKIEMGEKKSQSINKNVCNYAKLGWTSNVCLRTAQDHQIPSRETEKLVCKDLVYCKNIHESNMLCHPALYKLKRITHQKRLVNSCALLVSDDTYQSTVFLPSNSEAETAITIFSSTSQKECRLSPTLLLFF